MARSDSSVDSSEGYVFEIRSGLYQGSRHRLGPGRHVVGSGEDADLRLMESSLDATHAALVIGGSLVRVEGLADGVSVQDVGPVPSGSARTVRLPAVVEIGDILTAWSAGASGSTPTVSPQQGVRAFASRFLAFHVRRSDRQFLLSRFRSHMRRPMVPGAVAAAILAVTVSLTVANPKIGRPAAPDEASGTPALTSRDDVGGNSGEARTNGDTNELKPRVTAASLSAMTSTPAPAAAAMTADSVAKSAMGPVGERKDPSATASKASATPSSGAQSSTTKVAQAAAALEDEVRRAGLLNVHIAKGSNAVNATGSIEPGMASRWQSLQQGFDERFVGEVALVNSVTQHAEALPASLGIEGVMLGRNPHIVMRGQRYLIGAQVDGGWTIRGIEKDRVMLERDGRVVAMRF